MFGAPSKRKKKKDSASEIRAARAKRRNAERRVTAATFLQSFQRGRVARTILRRNLQNVLTKKIVQMSTLRAQLVKVHGPTFAFPAEAVNAVARQFLLLLSVARGGKIRTSSSSSSSSPPSHSSTFVSLGCLVAFETLRVVTFTKKVHDVTTANSLCAFFLQACAQTSTAHAHRTTLLQCVAALCTVDDGILLVNLDLNLFCKCISLTVTSALLPAAYWHVLLQRVCSTENIYVAFQRDVLSVPGRVQSSLKMLTNVLQRFKIKNQGVVLERLFQHDWLYTVPRAGVGDNDVEEDDDDVDEEERRTIARRAVAHNLAWLSVTARSFYVAKLTSTDATSTIMLIESLERRANALKELDQKRSDADAIQVSNLYSGLLRRLQTTTHLIKKTTEETKKQQQEQQERKEQILRVRIKWAEALLRRTFLLRDRRRWSEAAGCATRVERMGSGKNKLPFSLWKQSKNVLEICAKKIDENKKFIRKIVRKTKSRMAAARRKKDELRAIAKEEMKEAMRRRRAGEDKSLEVRMSLKEKRARQAEIHVARQDMLRKEREIIRERRKAASRLKQQNFFQSIAKRNAKRAAEEEQKKMSRKKNLKEITERIMLESERESSRVAERVVAMRVEMERRLHEEEEDRKSLVRVAREENQKKRKEMKRMKKEEERVRKTKEKEEWKKEDVAKEKREIEEEEERQREEQEEEEFEMELQQKREEERRLNPLCLFCGFQKEDADALCSRCHGVKEEEEEGEEKISSGGDGGVAVEDIAVGDIAVDEVVVDQSYSLWDFNSDEEDGEEEEDDVFHQFNNDSREMVDVPDEWCCPLTLSCFRDPVLMVEDQQVYERSAIEEWFRLGNTTSPMTSIEIIAENGGGSGGGGSGPPTLIPDENLRVMIWETLEEIAKEEEEEEERERERERERDELLDGEGRKQFRLSEQVEVVASSSTSSNNDDGVVGRSGETKSGRRSDEEEEEEEEEDSSDEKVVTLVRMSDDATMTMWCSSLAGRKKNEGAHASLLRAVRPSAPFLWVVLTVTAGRFAGAVFQRGVMIDHKTFSRYTTRRKQGGSQSAADGSGSGHAKSAGATLRRYNELALHQEIQELLLDEWSLYLEEAGRVWVSCGKSSAKLLYRSAGGKKKDKKKNLGALSKESENVIKVPFQTAKPTLEECKRICRCLATCWIQPTAYNDGEDDGNKTSTSVVRPPMRRGIPASDILPMETKRRKNIVKSVLEDGYGEVMVWEVPEERVTDSGWRNHIVDVEEEDGGSFLYF